MKQEKVVALLIAACMMLSVSGCNKNLQTAKSDFKITDGKIEYPIKTDVTLTYWVRLVGALGTSVTNYAETMFAKEYMERTGIKVTYQHPAQGQEIERLNLMIASGDFPDIIESDWLSRDPDSSIAKNTIIKLNDVIDRQAPNLKGFLSENPNIDKAIKTDTGTYYVFPFVRNGEKLLSTAGLMLRNDWIKELGLEVPDTIAEWENVLTAFKVKKGATAPLLTNVGSLGYFAGAFGIGYNYYINDGKVHFGSAEKNFFSYLTLMNKWYKSGIIDKNFAIMDNDFITSGMLSGYGGATFGAGGGGMGLYLNAAKENGQKGYDLVASKFPTEVKGSKPQFGNKQWAYSSLNGAAISGKCKNVDIAARFLDYSYSQEGHILNNFGIEGESYTMVNGYPTYTDLLIKNPKKLSMAQSLPLYVRSANEGPFIQDERYIEQYYQLDAQKNALNVWADNNHEKHAMPQITLTKDELSEFNKIMSDLTILRDEAVIAFIVGSKPLSEFDSYLEECKNMKLDRAIEIQQAAYERFSQRQ